MRFALFIALKYLIPKRKQLSVSIISLLSVVVISLVVWLSILFLSVTEGIEKKWLEEITNITAPLKVRPTEAYYNSYYYLIDSISLKSNYNLKTLGEKLKDSSDPYDPMTDIEPPIAFPEAHTNDDGSLKELVKEAKEAILPLATNHSGFRVGEFEAGFGNLHLTLLRGDKEAMLSQVSYIVGYDKENKRFEKLLMKPRKEDLDHLAKVISLSNEPLAIDAYMAHSNMIPSGNYLGEGIVLPKGFQKNKVMIGDRGHISYYTTATTGMQEQRLPIYVAGFYDPGMMPLGNKMIFTDPKIPTLLKGNIVVEDDFFGNGFAIWLDNLKNVDKAKQEIQTNLEKRGISSYFTVESFSDYEFSRPLLEQLKSDKHLFTLITIIILLVACSNVISMLLLLVNDKRKEIAVLQSMGATPSMIITIFAMCGFVTGAISCILGTIAAALTLHNLDLLIKGLSFLQGHDAFQSAFYGASLPNTLSIHSLIFIIVATFIVSILAGIVPALKAMQIRPSETLKSS